MPRTPALIGSPCLGVCTHCDSILCAGRPDTAPCARPEGDPWRAVLPAGGGCRRCGGGGGGGRRPGLAAHVRGSCAVALAPYGFRVEIMGSQTCRIVGKSQSGLIVINPIIFTRTRRPACQPCSAGLAAARAADRGEWLLGGWRSWELAAVPLEGRMHDAWQQVIESPCLGDPPTATQPSAPKPPYSPVSKSGQLSTFAPSLQPAAASRSGIV
eukprot:COSAG01_NODE_150_length_23941_cov_44.277200_15_plen_213_part_00